MKQRLYVRILTACAAAALLSPGLGAQEAPPDQPANLPQAAVPEALYPLPGSAPGPLSKRGKPRNAAFTRGLATAMRAGKGLYYRKGYVLKVGVNVIEADLNDPEIRVAAMVARGGIGTDESFRQMVNRARPAAA